ncbi:hypothetical protein PHISP_04647 [Aspergillus sp. HF37]|nr:hypothetical protein PHISP_04647 [Aspergillus sp. HF37]
MLMPQGYDDDSSSDYEPDFTADEEELVNNLLAKVAAEHATALHSPAATASLSLDQPPAPPVADIEDYEDPRFRSPKMRGSEKLGSPRSPVVVGGSGQTSGYGGTALVEDPNSSEGRERERERQISREQEWAKDATNADPNQPKSPLQRFRKPPNKAFSVTDLVSPAWCELQYWYSLTKFGRKRRTPAMKQGTTIHKGLEEEVHTTVPVEITTKEDAWALRIWNVVQGLRTLREFGTTRELEVWGLVDGELVTGVIDQLSYECPDPELEASAAAHYAGVDASRSALPEYQMSLSDYLLSPAQGGKKLSDVSWDGRDDGSPADEPSSDVFSLARIYMTDVKTRGSASVPSVKSSSFRPTLLQLQLYYHMLNRMVTSDDVSIDLLASRYNLDPTRPFTDTLIAEVGGLNDQFFDALSSQTFDPDHVPTADDARRMRRRDSESTTNPDKAMNPPSPSSDDSTTVLTEHNTLTSLWGLMKDQLRLTFLAHQQQQPQPSHRPHPPEIAPSIPARSQPSLLEPYPTLLSPLLSAEFVSSARATASESRVLGTRSFLFDTASLTSYLGDQMDWWRGKRAPRGVEIMEAWKCRICEFNEECSWRQEKEWDLAARRTKSRS